jgi:hypothetical protein
MNNINYKNYCFICCFNYLYVKNQNNNNQLINLIGCNIGLDFNIIKKNIIEKIKNNSDDFFLENNKYFDNLVIINYLDLHGKINNNNKNIYFLDLIKLNNLLNNRLLSNKKDDEIRYFIDKSLFLFIDYD